MKRSPGSFAILLSLTMLIVQFASAQDPPPEELPVTQIPGSVEGTGTHFEITDSEYLNITLDSTEEIQLRLESFPEVITMHLESAFGANSTVITLSGFPASTTFYKYEDDYHNLEVMTTDAGGSYTYAQDISTPHLVFIQTRMSTIFLTVDGWRDSSGNDPGVGDWDPDTLTGTLTTDVSETIQIDANDITLDGNGHWVTGADTGPPMSKRCAGVYLWNRTNVTIKNLTVTTSYHHGILLQYSDNNTLTDNTVSGNSDGVSLSDSSYNTLTGNTVLGNSNGIYLGFSHYNTLTDNTVSGNSNGIYLSESSYNTLTGNTVLNNLVGIYLLFKFSSCSNEVYYNNFIDNDTHAYSGGVIDTVLNLDPPIGGNYWGGWTDPDTNFDGSVDSPYVFTGGCDDYPWVLQDGWEIGGTPPGTEVVVDPVDPTTGESPVDMTFAEVTSAGVTTLSISQ